jgi:hypothetical protein
MKLNINITSGLPAGNAWFAAKRYKVFPTQVKHRSIKTIKSAYPHYGSSNDFDAK